METSQRFIMEDSWNLAAALKNLSRTSQKRPGLESVIASRSRDWVPLLSHWSVTGPSAGLRGVGTHQEGLLIINFYQGIVARLGPTPHMFLRHIVRVSGVTLPAFLRNSVPAMLTFQSLYLRKRHKIEKFSIILYMHVMCFEQIQPCFFSL